MPVHKFQGRDRRILSKANQVMTAMLARDAIASNPKPTAAISTRMLMIDPADAALVAAFTAMQTRIQQLLAM